MQESQNTIKEIENALIEKWKNAGYTNVEAIYLPNKSQIKISIRPLPCGCQPSIHEEERNGEKWREMASYKGYSRQTHKCQNHRYAIIYFTKSIHIDNPN